MRFLQEHTIERVCGRQEIEVDVRVVAATNTDLKRAMKEELFREDLYYRIAVVGVTLPPLRERGDDITVLAKVFLERFAAEGKKNVVGFSADAIKAMHTHDWPGNVRELENRVRRAVIMSEGRKLTQDDLELVSRDAERFKTVSLRQAREELGARAHSADVGQAQREHDPHRGGAFGEPAHALRADGQARNP